MLLSLPWWCPVWACGAGGRMTHWKSAELGFSSHLCLLNSVTLSQSLVSLCLTLPVGREETVVSTWRDRCNNQMLIITYRVLSERAGGLADTYTNITPAANLGGGRVIASV